MSIGTPVTVRPLNASAELQKVQRVRVNNRYIVPVLVEHLGQSSSQPAAADTSTFTLISPVLSFGIRSAPGRRSGGMPVGLVCRRGAFL